MCHIYQEKYVSLTSRYFIQFSSDHFFISQYLKRYDYLQIKGNLELFSSFATFLAAILSSTETSEPNAPNRLL